jgi:DNA modification methylase
MERIASLCPSLVNPRRGDVEAIRASLAAHDHYTPITVNRSTREVLVGNHRLAAAVGLGWDEILVAWIDVSEEEARKIQLVDNRSSDLAGWDEVELAGLLQEIGELDGTGFSEADLDELLDRVSADVPVEDDDVPELPAEPQTRAGEVITLGRHRLICGDARDGKALEQLMAGDEASCLLTDPPYGASYRGKTRRRLRIENDEPGDLDALLPAAFQSIDAHLGAGSPAYVFHPTGSALPTFVSAWSGVGWQLRQSLVWVKDALVLGHADYHYRHESILYGFKPANDGGRRGRGGEGWYGDNRQDSVIELPRPRAAREHPTMKPPELLARLLRNSTRRGGVVLDPFAGSGSTLVACERLGRSARLVEIDPAYCDVIAARYEQLTGQRREVG